MPPWALVCTFMSGTSCDLLFLEYPALTWRYQSPSVVRGIGLLGVSLLLPSVLASSLVMEWRPMPFSAAALALTSRPLAKCVCLAPVLAGARGPSLCCAYIPRCLRMTMSSHAHWSLDSDPLKNRFAFLLPASSSLWVPIIDLYQIRNI